MKESIAATPTPTPASRWWDWRAAALLLVALFAVASRLAATNWTENLQIAYVIALSGLIVGLAAGQSKFGLIRVLFFGTAYGVFIVLWQLVSTLGPKLLWMDRLMLLVNRLIFAVLQFAKQEPVQDPLLALVLFAILFWVMSFQAGYAITRHADPWQATLPGGLALLVIHTYDYRPAGPQFTTLLWAASIYFVMSLLLMARLNYLKRRQVWQARRVYYSPEVDTDILTATVVATIVLVVIAWLAPLTPNVIPPARDLWTIASQPFNAVRSRFGNMFTSLKASFGVVQDSYSSTLNLGRGNQLDDTPILQVDAPTPGAAGPRYYWRAWVYDTYDNGRWRNTFSEVDALLPDAFNLSLPQYASRQTSEITITPQVPIGTLYTPSQPLWVNRPVNATVAKDADGQADVASLQAAVTLYAGESYKVRSSLSVATISDLRSAGQVYPRWVIDHYLGSTGLSSQVQNLAQQIAAPYSTPYDKADAITNWLRQNIQYSDTVAATPPGRDTLEWFLFDQRQGFCNYYATAEVMMLRSLGIPARMAVGYAHGEANISDEATPNAVNRPGENTGLPDRITYLVRQRDAHAWPEVYFPKYGWVEFEPTVSQDPILRPLGSAFDTNSSQITPTPVATLPSEIKNSPLQDQQDPNAANSANKLNFTLFLLFLWIGIPLAILGLAFAGWKASQRFNLPPLAIMAERGLRRIGVTPPQRLQAWADYARLNPIEKAYQEVNDALRRLQSFPAPADTPTERVALLKHILPETAPLAMGLLAEYQAHQYGAKAANAELAREAGQTIRNVSWRRMLFLRLNGWRGDEPPQRYALWRT